MALHFNYLAMLGCCYRRHEKFARALLKVEYDSTPPTLFSTFLIIVLRKESLILLRKRRLIIVLRRIPRAGLIYFGVQGLHFFFRKLKVVDLRVLLNP